ncbi:hypothetical protein NC653_021820 [Populus alba x Populus x berolinensis]|uniref:Uncharacterized protein n=1 Tax=Populus alba x Populus x berolinensis TaxID=444605 RepID=A0AAD6QE98_9ROSI|nr:hypothetical protein NC653_021820 [Populus alba x Populus x berolinensis]
MNVNISISFLNILLIILRIRRLFCVVSKKFLTILAATIIHSLQEFSFHLCIVCGGKEALDSFIVFFFLIFCRISFIQKKNYERQFKEDMLRHFPFYFLELYF